RGTNENTNGLLREFFPKKTDLAKVNQEQLNYALDSINYRPRKCLNWKFPY
ncbi:TPA: IS30 family transposase, partial [Staphylococcus aureus]|nr:IS30 family transposase [Staphylococcus aureus]